MEPATITATTGWTTSDLQSGMDAADIHKKRIGISDHRLLIGVNNQYQGLPIDAYAVEFEALMDEAIALAGGRADRVFVVSIPDYGYTPFREANRAHHLCVARFAFNDTCRTRALQRGLTISTSLAFPSNGRTSKPNSLRRIAPQRAFNTGFGCRRLSDKSRPNSAISSGRQRVPNTRPFPSSPS